MRGVVPDTKVDAAGMADWSKTLADPHGPRFDEAVGYLHNWLNGVTPEGVPNHALPGMAKQVLATVVSAADRQGITGAYRRAHAGAEPTDGEILDRWSMRQKRLPVAASGPAAAPAPAAPQDAIRPVYAGDGTEWSRSIREGR